jgi:S-adenosylmethionine:tRNA-ribosyltransferase-isomerase (queuine synthetase)
MKLPTRLKALQQDLRSLNLKDKKTLVNWLQAQIDQEGVIEAVAQIGRVPLPKFISSRKNR